MSKYINLDDPDVTYSHNAGNHEVYIVGSEAERIDIVRCGECKHKYCDGNQIICQKLYWCDGNNFEPSAEDFCSQGERRADDDEK